ncbi:LamG domain-containing protein [Ruegeria sp. Ofav3-42]|uniref:LamG domain-containing protein n=1 Tax=Ruegeria sp. Ofav3-42 TaxID=2917759 RepID=UPI001EF58973|nr:LamG domain-containing protein [Ruegeria sp. Ofav3-42]MCG7522417.1 LamG domain-containing protein [Ruegeria sp. Ofav3-42]
MATINVSNASQLLSALSSAQGGDTIVLASGNYGSVDLKNLSYNSMVTVKSANPDKPAFFSNLDVDNVSHLRIDSIEVGDSGNGSQASRVVSITNSDNVEFLNSEVHGLEDNDYFGHYGIYANGNTDIKISGNYVHDVKNGLVIYPNQGIEISDNYVDYIGSDAFKFIGITDFLIENNTGGGHVYPLEGAGWHLDFMQFQGTGSSDGVVRGNVFLAQTDAAAGSQGIFMKGGTFNNILIEQNIIATGMFNGIKVDSTGGSSGIVMRDNTLVNIPDTIHKATTVIGANSSSGNLVTSYTQAVGSDFQADTDNYSQIFQGDIRLGLTLEDLRPVDGGAAEQFGATERLAELLDGTSYVPEPAPVEPEPVDPAPVDPVDPAPEEPAPVDPEPTVPDTGGNVPDKLEGTAFSMLGTQEFSGSKSDVVEIAHTNDLALDTGTISLSFNADTVSGRYGLLTKDASYYAGGGNHLAVYIDKGSLVVRFQDGSGDEIVRIPGINANQDYDLQLTFGDNEVGVWLNGQQVHTAEFSMTLADNVEHLQIGGLGWGSASGSAGFSNAFDGTISDVVIVEGKWSPEQMQELIYGSQPLPEAPVTEPEAPVTEPETPVTEPEAPVTEPEAPSDGTAKTVFEEGEAEFNGKTGSIINHDHDQALELEEGSIAFTFNADDLNGRQGLLSKDAKNYDGGDHLSVMLEGDDLVLRFQDAETKSDAYMRVEGIKANQDYDVQVWFDGEEIGLSLNGELVETQEFDFDLTANQQTLQIGGLGWSSSNGGDSVRNAFNGTVSDVQIVDEALHVETFDLLA